MPVLDPHDAAHRDQDVEVGVPGQHVLRGGLDARGVRDVDLDGVDARVLAGDLVKEPGAAAADDDGVPLGPQLQGEGEADAAGGAWDEDGVSRDVHAPTVPGRSRYVQRAVIGGSAIPGWRVCRRRPAAHNELMDQAALADFLRRRREALLPADVGLPPGARRRIRGLRREEVAGLAAMSVDYYTRLEQRRGPQ